MLKEITIRGKKELDIYMNPQRQRLLKCLEIHGGPMTPKQLSGILEISPSSVTFHLKKLMELGAVELDHTEMIHGICAKYYRHVPVQVNLKGSEKDDLQFEKEVLMDYVMDDVWSGFKRHMKSVRGNAEAEKGEMSNGVLYLKEEDVQQLKQFIFEFQQAHSVPEEGAAPWEVTLVAYPRREV